MTQPAPDSRYQARVLVNQARLTDISDGGVRTQKLLTAALEADPHHHDTRLLLERLYQTFIPRWHFPMLGDAGRNRAYAEAINATVREGDIVLDIGSGAGLTAMLAARAGAKHVYACENQPLIAQAATKIIAANGLSDRITIIPKWSHDLKIGEDLPEPADVVISEIVDTVLLGEGAIPTLVHAMGALAKPNARTVPERGILYAQPIESETLFRTWRLQTAEGFDLSHFHQFANVAELTPNDVAAYGLKALGPPVALFEFDFARPSLKDEKAEAELICDRAGEFHAVLISFDLHLTSEICVTSGIDSDGHWGRTAFLCETERRMTPGDTVGVQASHDCAALNVTIGL
ncbi:MAG: 50S ribosomal protein L11 methyltransferase [Pseudomonadota bacterium]